MTPWNIRRRVRKHWSNGRYVVRHKWFVMLACFEEGLYVRGLAHDTSKFRPSEWFPYADHFFGEGSPNARFKYGYSKGQDTRINDTFDRAWLKHIHRHDHHWQWWLLQEGSGDCKAMPMSTEAMMEMLCDWKGAGRAQGVEGGWKATKKWYQENKERMILAPQTRVSIESLIDILAGDLQPDISVSS